MSKRFVKSKEEIIENIKSFHGLGAQFGTRTSIEEKEYEGRIGDALNIIRIKVNGEYFYTPSKFVGYYRDEMPNRLARHRECKHSDGSDGRDTSPAITNILGQLIKEGDENWDSLEREYKDFQLKIRKKFTNHRRKYWIIENEIQQ